MASLDYKYEKNYFRDFYTDNLQILESAQTSFCALITALVSHSGSIAISKVEGRVKDKEECLRKFNLKYRKDLESKEIKYEIKDHISDLIGIRVVCLYEDDIEKIKNVLDDHFEVIDVTDKISQIEKTEGSFGYKGLHLDLKLGPERRCMLEYRSFVDFNFEIQIRTIVQDSWSVLDHKIKYKKKIPNKLKRRINTLAALFELADREFLAIRAETELEIQKAEKDNTDETSGPQKVTSSNENSLLTAFGFLKIANHFFKNFDADAHKVDGFTDEIVSLEPEITRTKLNTYMKEGIAMVKAYNSDLETTKNSSKATLKPYTMIRHCLYLGNRKTFSSILTNSSKESFESWLTQNNK